MESYSLFEFNQSIRQCLKDTMPQLYWVTAEINEMHVNGAGHCFLELIEKARQGEQIIAKARANIWAYHFRMLSPYFETMTGQRLSSGLKVMLRVSVEFHEAYGFSFQVTDINPAFTVGDLALQRQAIIRKLTDEGVIDMNRGLELTLVPQRIAVISSESAAGYGDFIDQLHHNASGYAFRHTLFQAVMQGNDAEASIIHALEEVFDREEEFDAVVIIRGGGSQSDLNCFNSYLLACYIAQFPLPVLTGIGHDRDETIADMVAHTSLKTPTAVAEYLIERASSVDEYLKELTSRLARTVMYSLESPAKIIQLQSQRIQKCLHSYLNTQEKCLQTYKFRLSNEVLTLLSQKRVKQFRLSASVQSAGIRNIQKKYTELTLLQRLFNRTSYASISANQKTIKWLDNKLKLLDPANLLQRGYSITLSGKKIVKSASDLKEGQHIETIFSDGKVESVVEKINKAL